MDKEYVFNSFNDYSNDGISMALRQFVQNQSDAIIVGVGSDLLVGDSLGPLTCTMIKKRCSYNFIYGTLDKPVTAKDIKVLSANLKLMHPKCKIIAIDASVGSMEDVGLIKVFNRGIKPGLGVNKNLPILGDVSIVGVVAQKTPDNSSLFNFTRLNLIYRMSEIISEGIGKYLAKDSIDKNLSLRCVL